MSDDEYLSVSIKDIFLVVKKYKFVFFALFVSCFFVAAIYLHFSRTIQLMYPVVAGKMFMGVRMDPYEGEIFYIESDKIWKEKYESSLIRVELGEGGVVTFSVYDMGVDEGLKALNDIFLEITEDHDKKFKESYDGIEKYWQEEKKTEESEKRRAKVFSRKAFLNKTKIISSPIAIYGNNRGDGFFQIISFHLLRLTIVFFVMSFLTAVFVMAMYEKMRQK